MERTVLTKAIIEKGQTLVTLLFFMIIAITVTSAAVAMIILNSQSTSKLEQGVIAYYIAESGAENAMLRLLRNPSYTGEELPVGDGTATITISGSDPKTIRSVGAYDSYKRTVEVVATYTSNVLTVSSWKEVYN